MWFLCTKRNDGSFLPLAAYAKLEPAIRSLQTQFAYIPYDSVYLFESFKDPLRCHMVDKKLFID